MKYLAFLTIVLFLISCNENKSDKPAITKQKEVKENIYNTFNSTSINKFSNTRITPIKETEIINNEKLLLCKSSLIQMLHCWWQIR